VPPRRRRSRRGPAHVRPPPGRRNRGPPAPGGRRRPQGPQPLPAPARDVRDVPAPAHPRGRAAHVGRARRADRRGRRHRRRPRHHRPQLRGHAGLGPQAPVGTMPELPEVESVRRRAERALRGRRIAEVTTTPDSIVYDGVSPGQFEDALRGRRVLAVRRKGKHLWMELDKRPWPVFHFGMTGWLELYRREEDRPRFWKLELRMDDGTRLGMPDGRRLGRIRLRYEPEREPPLAGLGFDLLLDPPPEKELVRLL